MEWKLKIAEAAGLDWVPFEVPYNCLTGPLPNDKSRWVKSEVSWRASGITAQPISEEDWTIWRQAVAIYRYGSVQCAEVFSDANRNATD